MPPELMAACSTISLSLVLLGIIVMLLSTAMTGSRSAATVKAMNWKLDMLMKHAGINVEELAVREVQALGKDGAHAGKIQAIKRYRDITGASLAEAKAAVERIQGGAGPA